MSRTQDGRKKKNKGSRQHRQILYIGGLLAAVCCLLTGVWARYIHQTTTENSQITAENFYFTANLLGDTRMTAVDDTSQESYVFGEASTEGTWNIYGAGEHQIRIQVQNYYDELRVTQREIVYTGSVTVTDASGNTVTKGEASSFPELKINNHTFVNGTLSANSGAGSDTLTLDIPSFASWNYTDGTAVTAKIESTSPYRKTMTMRFILYAADTTLKYQVIDSAGSPYAELILMTDVANTVQPVLRWSKDLNIDNTNPLTFTYDSKTGTFTQQSGMTDRNMRISEALRTGRSEAIYFFKNDTTKNYSRGETVVYPQNNAYTVQIG